MSYLNPTRLHFAGTFRADVSTVNNDPAHFDDATFVAKDRQPAPDASQAVDGWWQPQGTGAWKIEDCTVTGAVLNGAAAADGVVGLQVRDSGDRVSGKLVDLDPDAQMVSTIFGLEFRIVDPVRMQVLLKGKFEPVGFFDLMAREVSTTSNAFPLSAFFQSVLTDVHWGDIEGSPVLKALQAASPQTLSIRFMVDQYYMDTPERGYGRLVGTIGPQRDGDPLHFTPGRYLAPTTQPQGSPFLGYVGCWLDQQNRKVIADFGNALPTVNGATQDQGPLSLVILPGGSAPIDLGQLEGYSAPGWYEQTAGIQAFPPDRSLTDAELTALAANPLGAALSASGLTILAAEPDDGVFLRPDLFVYRMEPFTQQQARAMVLKFGQPLQNATVVATVTGGPPDDGVTAENGTTGPDGWATLNFRSIDPKLPRAGGKVDGGPDGQVYSIRLGTPASTAQPGAGTGFWPFAAVAIQVYSQIAAPEAPSWTTDVLPILQQYSNLYPRPHGPDSYSPYADQPPLHPVVNLSNQAQVEAYAPLIQCALQRHIKDPAHMPVTRDLSAGRRRILLNWLGGLGQPAVAAGAAEAAPSHAKAAAPPVEATQPAQAPARDFAAERTAFVAAAGYQAAAPSRPRPDLHPAPKSKMPSKEVK